MDLRERKWLEAEEEFIMRSFVTFTFHQILLGGKKSRRMKWMVHVARMKKINAYKILVGKPERKIQA
jgi:hypothetical protein